MEAGRESPTSSLPALPRPGKATAAYRIWHPCERPRRTVLETKRGAPTPPRDGEAGAAGRPGPPPLGLAPPGLGALGALRRSGGRGGAAGAGGAAERSRTPCAAAVGPGYGAGHREEHARRRGERRGRLQLPSAPRVRRRCSPTATGAAARTGPPLQPNGCPGRRGEAAANAERGVPWGERRDPKRGFAAWPLLIWRLSPPPFLLSCCQSSQRLSGYLPEYSWARTPHLG